MLDIRIFDLSEQPSERIKRMKESFIQTRANMSVERAKILTASYLENESAPIELKRARGLADILRRIPIFIEEDELLVGHPAASKRGAEVFPERHMDWVYNIEEFETRDFNSLHVPPNAQSELLEIYPFWKKRSIRHRLMESRPSFVEAALSNGLTINPHQWNGLGHMAPEYEMILSHGLIEIRKQAEQSLAALELGDIQYYEKSNFFRSMILLVDATADYAARYAELAEEQMHDASPKRRKELEKIASVCRRVPLYPARDYHEALQCCWFLLLIPYLESNGFSISLGRMDQYINPYLTHDLDREVLSIAEAQELLDMLYLKTCEVLRVDDSSFAWSSAGYSVGENLVVGGVDRNGRDCTNLFSFMALNANMHIQLHQPNFTVRLSDNTPDVFLAAVARAISKGNGMPQLLNDEVIIPALLAKGIPLERARDYAPIGCDEITVSGLWGRCNGGYLNFAKVLELTLNEGKCMLSGEQVGLKTPPVSAFQTFEDLLAAFFQQFDYAVALVVNEANRTDWVHKELEPVPFLSMLCDGCMENGLDVAMGGARYNSTGPVGIGTANAADSLEAIRKAVFEEKRFTLEQIVHMQQLNFEGFETERLYLRNKIPKFGNDVEEVDSLAVLITNRWFDQLEKYRNVFNGQMWPALYSVSAQVSAGNVTAATADGRLATLPLSDGLTPMYGCDLHGPTAALRSVSKVDTMRSPNGVIVNQRLNPSVFRTEQGFEKFQALLRSFVNMRSFHWQFNCIGSETLHAAQEDPDSYRDLVVRVAGYSAIFVDLSKKAQDSIIARTEAEL